MKNQKIFIILLLLGLTLTTIPSVSAYAYNARNTGSISVSSSPSGARIYLDGIDTGYTTPRTISGLSIGTHMIRISKPGYVDKFQAVTVSADKITSISFSLTPTMGIIPNNPQSGALKVIDNTPSTPTGSSTSGSKLFGLTHLSIKSYQGGSNYKPSTISRYFKIKAIK